jgi:hypothetical protein
MKIRCAVVGDKHVGTTAAGKVGDDNAKPFTIGLQRAARRSDLLEPAVAEIPIDLVLRRREVLRTAAYGRSRVVPAETGENIVPFQPE